MQEEESESVVLKMALIFRLQCVTSEANIDLFYGDSDNKTNCVDVRLITSETLHRIKAIFCKLKDHYMLKSSYGRMTTRVNPTALFGQTIGQVIPANWFQNSLKMNKV